MGLLVESGGILGLLAALFVGLVSKVHLSTVISSMFLAVALVFVGIERFGARIGRSSVWRSKIWWDDRTGITLTVAQRVRAYFGAWFGRLVFYVGATAVIAEALRSAGVTAGFLSSWVLCLAPGVTLVTYRIFRIRGLGATRLGFARFPFEAGSRAGFLFRVDDEAGASFRTLTFTLRCIRDGRLGLSRTLLYEDVRDFGIESALPSPGSDLVVEFDLPADVATTSLPCSEPVYWQLEVRGESTSGSYREAFPILVMDRRD